MKVDKDGKLELSDEDFEESISDSSGENEVQDLDDFVDGMTRKSPYEALSLEDDSLKFLRITFRSNKKMIKFMRMPGNRQDEDDRYERLDGADENTIRGLSNKISSAINKMRGSGLAQIFEKIGAPIKVDMDWTEEIIRFVNDLSLQAMSNDEIRTWSKENIYFRHITKVPGTVKIPKAIPVIYIMFDQSGSMSNEEVREINGVIQYFFEKNFKVIVMIHDWGQEIKDIKLYEFSKKTVAADNTNLENLVSSRVMCGGTSHKGAFDLMEMYIDEVTKTTMKYGSHFCFICSDLDSDIESIWKNYEWPKLIGNTTIALTNSNYELPFGRTMKIL